MMSGRPGGGGKQIRTMAPMTDCGYSRKKIRVALLWSTSEKRKIWASCVYRTSNTYSKCCLCQFLFFLDCSVIPFPNPRLNMKRNIGSPLVRIRLRIQQMLMRTKELVTHRTALKTNPNPNTIERPFFTVASNMTEADDGLLSTTGFFLISMTLAS